MLKSNIYKHLKSLGWFEKKISTDKVLAKDIGDRICICFPFVRRFSDGYTVSAGNCLTTKDLSYIYNKIDEDSGSDYFLISSSLDNNDILYNVASSELNVSLIEKLSSETINWCINFDINNELDKFINYPTNSFGNRPIKHLTALAFRGRSDILQKYYNSFMFGDRLGFVPLVSLEMIKSALDVSKSYKTNN